MAQSVANYAVTRSTGVSYNSIIPTGNSFASWRYTGFFSEDDNRSEATNIGFDFWYNGQRFTQFSVSTNGFMDFSSSTDDGGPQCDDYGYCNFIFSASNNGTWLALAPFYDDMTTRAGSDPLGTSIKYELSGTAPNRVLTVEWDAMAVFNNTSPDLNFQVKIYETTGVIEYLYETMNSGTHPFSYTVGINASSISNTPQASELKTQQAANSTNFSQTPQNNLSTMPAANSRLRFTPPTPAAATGTLTASAITNTGMTLNWPNWASNEVGYVLYSSVDDVNYFFNSQTPVNATSANIAGLLPGTNYYWRLYAVTEGRLSAPLSTSATTLPPATVTSITSGRWDRTNTWDCNCIPSAGDNVVIQNNHNVRLRSNSNMECNNLTIGQGSSGSARYVTNSTQTLTINGTLTVNNGASFFPATNSNAIHIVNFRGNIINNGSIDLATDANSRVNANFIKQNGNQTLSGTGTNSFFTIAVDKSLKSNILDITANNFSCDPDALTFTSGGTFRFSSPGANIFQLFTTTRDIPINGQIWMNSVSSTMTFGAGINLRGDLRLQNGNLNIGDATNENLISFGGYLQINGGAMRIAGAYLPNDPETTSNFQQSSGTLALPTVSSTSTSLAPFSMNVTGSSLIISGGTIIIQREGGTGAQNLGFNTSGVTVSNITGGTLQIGNVSTPAAQTFLINSGTPIGNLLVNNANATAQLTANDITVLNNVTLASGRLLANGRNITLGGNWLATAGTFTTSLASTVTFNGVNQSITTAGSPFNNLILSGSGTKSLQDNLIVNSNLTFGITLVPVNSGFTCVLGGNWTNNGSFTRNNETITFNGTTAQNIAGSSITNFTNINVNKASGTVSVNGTVNLHGTLTMQSSTTFDADGTGSGILTLISAGDDPAIDARVATMPAGASITGNVTVQRYMAPEVPGTTRVYRYISSPASGQFVSDWQDDFPITGTFSNPSTEFPIGSGITSVCGIPLIPANPSLYRYVEPNTGSGALDLGWQAYPASGSSTAAAIQVGLGYAAFIRECTNPTIIDVRGPLNQGLISYNSMITLTSNGDVEDGFNLVGNPYPSAIDWDVDAGWTRTGISSVIYIRDNGGTGGFTTYDYTDNTPQVIAQGQAFWVRVTGTPNFSINEQAKTSNGSIFYRTGSIDKLSINLTKGNVTDKAIVKINPQSNGRLDDFDGPKLDNTLFDVSTLSEEGMSMAVNSLDKVNCGGNLAMKIKDMTNGSYDFTFERQGLFTVLGFQLHDKFTETTVDVDDQTVYSFNVTGAAGSKAADRFELIFPSPTPTDTGLSIAGDTICQDEEGLISISSSQRGITYYASMGGQAISEIEVGSGQDLALRILPGHLSEGLNAIQVMATNACGEEFAMDQSPIIDLEKLSPPKISIPDPVCGEGSVLLSATEVPFGTTVNWFANTLDTTPLFSGNNFATPVLSKSRTYYASIASANGCTSDRVSVVATVIPFDPARIEVSGDTLISNYEVGNTWTLNGQMFGNSSAKQILISTNGLYGLQVKVAGGVCISSDEVQIVVAGDEEVASKLNIFPNPVRDVLEIRAPLSFEDHVTMTDVNGRTVTGILLNTKGEHKAIAISVSDLPSGIYYLKAIEYGSVIHRKIIKK